MSFTSMEMYNWSWYSHILLMLKQIEEVKQTMHESTIKSSYDHEIKRNEWWGSKIEKRSYIWHTNSSESSCKA